MIMDSIISSLIEILKNHGVLVERVLDGEKVLVVENVKIENELICEEREVDVNYNNQDDVVIISSEKLKQVETVFDFWNSYKGEGWKSHVKLSYDIKTAIIDALKKFSVEEICSAIDNYHTILSSDEYFWNHVWPLSTFLSVKYGNAKDSPKKWWQFLPNNFVAGNYVSSKCKRAVGNNVDKDENVELTNKIIRMYSILVNNTEFCPEPHQMSKFVEASRMMVKFFKARNLGSDVNPVECLKYCLDENYINKGETLFPGHLCSKNTWEILMPQAISGLGCE